MRGSVPNTAAVILIVLIAGCGEQSTSHKPLGRIALDVNYASQTSAKPAKVEVVDRMLAIVRGQTLTTMERV